MKRQIFWPKRQEWGQLRFCWGWLLEANVQPRVTTAAGVPPPGSDGWADISNQPTCLIRAFHTCYPDLLNKYKWFEAKAANISRKYSSFKQKIFHICNFWLCQNVERKQSLLNSIFYISGVAKFCRLKFGWIDLRFSDICFHDYPRIFMKTHFRAVHFLPIYDSNFTIGNDKLVSGEVEVLWTKWTGERLHQKQ